MAADPTLAETGVTGADDASEGAKKRRSLAALSTSCGRRCCHSPAAAGGISKEGQEELGLLRQMINPRQLKREIYDSLHRIFMLPIATSGVTEDVYQTLRVAAVA